MIHSRFAKNIEWVFRKESFSRTTNVLFPGIGVIAVRATATISTAKNDLILSFLRMNDK